MKDLETMQREGREGLRAEVKKWPEMDALGTSAYIDQHTANTWKACKDAILESGLLEEKTVKELYPEANTEVADHKLACQVFGKERNNTLARAVKELISNMDTNSVDSIHSNKQANYLMKTTSLPSVQEVYETTLTKEDDVSIPNLLTQDRNQAYTRLVEGIEEMKPHVRNVPPSDKQSIEAVCLVQVGYEQCKKDFLENVVKPLYGKLEL